MTDEDEEFTFEWLVCRFCGAKIPDYCIYDHESQCIYEYDWSDVR